MSKQDNLQEAIIHIELKNLLVEVSGLEPLTSCLQSRRSTN